ncbi:MAG: folate family ECF transporter S component [Oscillospiraceae bacterium]
MQLFKSPLSPGYWSESLSSLRSLRNLSFAALMVAAAIVLSLFYIPIGENLRLTVSFLARALCALVCGPVLAMVYGVGEDLLGWMLHPTGGFFPGYTLSTMLGVLIYALCFYRRKITLRSILLAKLLTNYGVNVLLGSVWSALLYSKGYLYYFTASLVKNTLYLPLQVILLVLLFRFLLPVLQRQKLIPIQVEGRIRW